MSRPGQPFRAGPGLRRAKTLYAAAVLAALCEVAPVWVLPAYAQSTDELRGGVSEDETNNALLRQRSGGAPSESVSPNGRAAARPGAAAESTVNPYEPTNLGGLTKVEEEARQSGGALPDIVEDPDAANATNDPLADAVADPFAEAPPIPSGRPTTADQRSKGAEERSREVDARTRRGPQTAAQRAEAAEQEEEALTTGTVPQPTVDTEEESERIIDPGAQREGPIEGIDRQEEENPYEPVGIRVGSFILRPSLEQGFTYTTNANSTLEGGSAVLSETTGRLNVVSDWDLHTATFDAYGIITKSISGEEFDEVEGGLDGALDFDLGHQYKLKTTLGYTVKPEGAASPVDLGDVAEEPLRHTFDGSVGLTKELGKARFGITAKTERNVYEDAALSAGGILSQKDRNSTLATLALRAGYEISPAITPFVEAEIGRRFYDEEKDAAGFERSADRLAGRVGIAVDTGEKLVGEFSAGWLRESFDDDDLDPISGANIAANLRWSPERGTTVGLNASTTVEGTTTPNESGSLLHSGRLTLERQVRANLTANAALGVDWRTYNGSNAHDLTFTAETGATWWLNRYLGLTGRLRHEQMKSDLPGRGFQDNSVFLGMKVQR